MVTNLNFPVCFKQSSVGTTIPLFSFSFWHIYSSNIRLINKQLNIFSSNYYFIFFIYLLLIFTWFETVFVFDFTAIGFGMVVWHTWHWWQALTNGRMTHHKWRHIYDSSLRVIIIRIIGFEQHLSTILLYCTMWWWLMIHDSQRTTMVSHYDDSSFLHKWNHTEMRNSNLFQEFS